MDKTKGNLAFYFSLEEVLSPSDSFNLTEDEIATTLKSWGNAFIGNRVFIDSASDIQPDRFLGKVVRVVVHGSDVGLVVRWNSEREWSNVI